MKASIRKTLDKKRQNHFWPCPPCRKFLNPVHGPIVPHVYRLGNSLPNRWLRQKLGGAAAEPMLLSALSTGNHQLASLHWGEH